MIKSIHTSYNGFSFRSRCEARYAVFFDALGVKYRYETDGKALTDGSKYLPDFWLPELQCWFEVKGQEPNEAERRKAEQLSLETEFPLVFGIDEPEAGMHAENLLIVRAGFNPQISFFAICEQCEKATIVGLVHDCPGSLSISHFKLLSATRAARSARFEFGQRGAIDPNKLRTGGRRING